MPLTLDDSVLDSGLEALRAADSIYACSSEPMTYQDVITNALGVQNYGGPNLAFNPEQDWIGGRTITSNSILGVGTHTGTATFWAAVNSSTQTLLAKSEVIPFSVVANKLWTLSSFTIRINDNPGFAPVSSAGVFDSTGKLVRELWLGQTNNINVNNPAAAWDGTLNDLSVAPSGTYTIKVLSHNIGYTWEGVVGNSSPNHLSTTYHNPSSIINSMAITDAGEIYYTSSYNEKYPVAHYTTTADPQTTNYINLAYSATHSCCTDGNITYFTTIPAGGETQSWVWGVKCSDKTMAVFSAGTPNIGYNNFSAIAYYNGTAWLGAVYGMAVQKTGNFLFITQSAINTVLTANKTTGATLQTNTSFTSPNAIATNPATGEVWLVNTVGGNPVVTKLSVNVSTGALSTTGVQITGLSNPVALAVSPDGTMLLVADAGISHQVKAFNTSDGTVKTAWSSSGILGTLDGYVASPTVTNTKFMFRQLTGMGGFGDSSLIAFASDGSFWLGDDGNCRVLHFSSGNSPAYLEQISYVASGYACQVCRGDPTRVFYNHLEWKIDYSQPLAPGNGSWTLANNWGNSVTSTNTDQYGMLGWVSVYSNGRVYGTRYDTSDGLRHVYELAASGLRDTGKTINAAWVDEQFNLYTSSNIIGGLSGTISKNAFTGFDSSNNPTWQHDSTQAPPDVQLTTGTMPALFPGLEGGWTRSTIAPLANNVIPIFNPHGGVLPQATDNHLGGIDATSAAVKFSTHPATPQITANFNGSAYEFLYYPEAPYFPYGVENGGGALLYQAGATDCFTGYRGEGWAGGQCNIWQHWHESGLFLGRFGVMVGGGKGTPGMAGNTAWGGIAQVNGKWYLYHNDEWYHAGLHRWRIDNLASLLEENISVVWDSTTYTPVTDPTDMLAGLPFNAALPATSAGWTRTQTTDITTSYQGPYLKVYTNAINVNPRESPDIVFEAWGIPGQTYSVYRGLARSGSGDWLLSGALSIGGSGAVQPGNPSLTGTVYIDILDSTGKFILRITNITDVTTYPYRPTGMTVNGTFIAPPTPAQSTWWAYIGVVRNFSVASVSINNTIVVSYGDYQITAGLYDPTADITSPARFSLTYVGNAAAWNYGGNLGGGNVSITKLNFQSALAPGVFTQTPALLTLSANVPNRVLRDTIVTVPTASLAFSADFPITGAYPNELITGMGGFWQADKGVSLSGSNVTVWADQSPLGNNLGLTGGAVVYNATTFNGHPGISFIASNNAGIQTSPVRFTSSTWSMFMLVRIDVADGGRIQWEWSANGNDYVSPGMTAFLDGSYFSYRSSGYLGNTGGPLSISTGTYYLLGVVCDGTKANLWVNGAIQGLATTYTTNVGDPNNDSYLGLGYNYVGNGSGNASFTVACHGITELVLDVNKWANLLGWCQSTFGAPNVINPNLHPNTASIAFSLNTPIVSPTNLSLQPISASLALTTSAPSYLITAYLSTLVGQVPASLNFLPATTVNGASDFTNTQWIKQNCTIATGITGPDGTSNAQHLTESASSTTHNLYCQSPQLDVFPVPQRFVVIAKAAERTRMVLAWDSFEDQPNSDISVGFDLSGGNTGYDQVVGSNVTLLASAMTSLSAGYWLCTLDFVHKNTTIGPNVPENSIYIDSGSGTAARNTGYTGDGTSGIDLFWANILPLQAWSITSRAFFDDFNAPLSIDYSDTRAPGINWYIHNLFPNSSMPTFGWQTNPPSAPSLPATFTNSSPSILQIQTQLNDIGWTNQLWSVATDGGHGYVGQVFKPPMVWELYYNFDGDPADWNSNWTGIGGTLWGSSIQCLTNTGLNPSYHFLEWDAIDSGSQYASMTIHDWSNPSSPVNINYGAGIFNPGMRLGTFRRASGMWITAAANNGWGCFLTFADGQLDAYTAIAYNACLPTKVGPAGLFSQSDHHSLPLFWSQPGNNGQSIGPTNYIDYIRVYANPSPPNVWAFWDIFDQPNADITLATNGTVLTKTTGTTWSPIRASQSKIAGKWYWEIIVAGASIASATSFMLGISNGAAGMAGQLGSYAKSAGGVYGSAWNANISGVTGQTSSTVAWANGDVFGFALDADAGVLYIHRNGTYIHGNPGSGNGVYSGLTGETQIAAGGWYPAVAIHDANVSTLTANFGASAFSYSVPGGYNSGFYS